MNSTTVPVSVNILEELDLSLPSGDRPYPNDGNPRLEIRGDANQKYRPLAEHLQEALGWDRIKIRPTLTPGVRIEMYLFGAPGESFWNVDIIAHAGKPPIQLVYHGDKMVPLSKCPGMIRAAAEHQMRAFLMLS